MQLTSGKDYLCIPVDIIKSFDILYKRHCRVRAFFPRICLIEGLVQTRRGPTFSILWVVLHALWETKTSYQFISSISDGMSRSSTKPAIRVVGRNLKDLIGFYHRPVDKMLRHAYKTRARRRFGTLHMVPACLTSDPQAGLYRRL